jgi:RNA polymerase sigma factor (sigma-70 family)
MTDEHESHPVPGLVAAALAGDDKAWNRLVERFTPLVLSVVRRHRLHSDDAEDVVQTIWLRLVEHLRDLREPQALPGWIVTTTRNECLRLIRGRQHLSPTEFTEQLVSQAMQSEDVGGELLEAERHQSLLAALAQLPERDRALLLLLIEDPPPSYQDISRRLGLPVGSIGPTRARALNRLRASAMASGLSIV